MKKKHLKTYVALFVGLVAMIFTGCKDQKNGSDLDRPTYPPTVVTPDENRNELDRNSDTLYDGTESNQSNTDLDTIREKRINNNTSGKNTTK